MRDLITNLAAHITQPLARLNIEMGDFLAGPYGDRVKLKDQPFMQTDKLGYVIATFLANLRDRVPFVVAHIRVYLANAGGGEKDATTAQSTASILFKPVQLRLVDSWGRLEGVLEEGEMDQATLDTLGFVRPRALGDLIDSMFHRIMEAPWEELVDIVNQVPRSKVSVRPSPSASPRAPSPVPASGSSASAFALTPVAAAQAAASPAAALAAREVVAASFMLPAEVAAASPALPAAAETVPPPEAASPPPALVSSDMGLPTTASLEV